jgi:hypothetical protein
MLGYIAAVPDEGNENIENNADGGNGRDVSQCQSVYHKSQKE